MTEFTLEFLKTKEGQTMILESIHTYDKETEDAKQLLIKRLKETK